MKLFQSDQIKQIDEYTIKEEPVASIDLMERAAGQLLRWYLSMFERSHRVIIFAGPGNNGGDGLALARLLESNRYETRVYYVEFTDRTSEDWKRNHARLNAETKVPFFYLKEIDQFPVISSTDIIIDAIFGSGLTRPAQGLAAGIIKNINHAGATVISIDIPSGMYGEDNSKNDYDSIISADYTLSFHFPKLAFMFPENAAKVGEWIILPLGLSANAIRNISSPYVYTLKNDVFSLLKKRNKFDHKGVFGHGLLISGSYGKMGAAVLGARAALRTGIGLISCHIPSCGVDIIQTSIPEAMVKADQNEKHLSEISGTDNYSAIGVGPGIGTGVETQMALHTLLRECRKPMVIDADAINILSLNKTWLSLIYPGTILTPHPKEFERLAGETENSFYRLQRQIGLSVEFKCIIVLKGANTSITTPEGKVFFNSTGNPGMATAGSGDVLTGILLALLAQGYPPENASVLGVYLHGLAGDMASDELCQESIIASDIINNIPFAFNKLKEPEI
jgi:ADP-dependent NAD(P)H-hydrate dehydratase / NAD(P)H-hydrate epimerase